MVEAIAAPGAGKALVIYSLVGSNSGGALSTVDFKDGSTVEYSLSMAASGGGFGPAIRPWTLRENQALNLQQSAVVNSWVTVQYEILPV